jgi:hypothetical protein
MPKVVSAVISAAEKAIADEKLPRAIALADRAAALAPNDERVALLVERVTEGGQASKRRRVLALVGGAAVLAGGATVGAMKLFASESTVSIDAAASDVPHDATTAEPSDAIIATNEIPDGAVAMITDAGIASADASVRTRPDAALLVRADAAIRTRDAAVAIDASLPRPDAAMMAMPPPDAAIAATGEIVVRNDTWCDVVIDGVPRGRANAKPIRVDAGTHTVVCQQPGTENTWTKTIDVAAGKTAIASGSMLGTFPVTLEVDATIDGRPYARGTMVNLKRGRHELVVGGAKSRFDLSGACTVRSAPEPGCY